MDAHLNNLRKTLFQQKVQLYFNQYEESIKQRFTEMEKHLDVLDKSNITVKNKGDIDSLEVGNDEEALYSASIGILKIQVLH